MGSQKVTVLVAGGTVPSPRQLPAKVWGNWQSTRTTVCKGESVPFEEYQWDTCATGGSCLSAMEIRDDADSKGSILIIIIIIPADEYQYRGGFGDDWGGGYVWLPTGI